MEFVSASGHVFYLNHLISAVITFLGGWVFFHYMRDRKFDKCKHLFVSGLLTFIFFHLCYWFKLWMWWSPIVALTIGFVKEVIDKFNKKKGLFDWKDIVADFVGIAMISLIYLFSFVFHKGG